MKWIGLDVCDVCFWSFKISRGALCRRRKEASFQNTRGEKCLVWDSSYSTKISHSPNGDAAKNTHPSYYVHGYEVGRFGEYSCHR